MRDRHKWVERRLVRTSWLVRSDYEQSFLAACQRGWGGGEVLRSLPYRQVLKLEGQPPLVVKVFRHVGMIGWLKVVFRGTPAGREWRNLRGAVHRGLPAPVPVALGEDDGLIKGESIVVTEALEGAVPLENYLWGEKRPVGTSRNQVIGKFASLVRKAHDLGFNQSDLHLGNVLVRPNAETCELFLVDLQRVKLSASLNPRSRWHNLAALHGGCTNASRTDRLRFLKHYLCCPAPLPFDLRKLVSQLEHKGRRHRLSLWRSRQKRCLAENGEFMRVRGGTFFGFARRKHWEENLQGSLREPGKIFQQTTTKVVKNSKTTSVAIVDHPAGEFYVKRYNYQGIGYAIKDLFRSSRARRTWVAANSLRMRGIPVALPLAYLERRRLGILLESYIVTEAKTGLNLRLIFNRYAESRGSLKVKRVLLNDLACLVRKMHAHGVAHRDLKGTNIVAQERANGNYDLFIVDFDGISLGEVSPRRRAKDLARLAEECQRHRCFTRSDRLRFLKVYLAGNDQKNWKKIWRMAARRY